ncbi:hypothetical protein DDB_G0292718 [Dictyostelium discoideum AX4]|uniref:Uncharacterized protein n=1 Tax=Dictyostelium discoideum TaxID=44689 RepID=Q54D18_DICDI|nr:hypothetical protein DDB_G0292718 [Dictyostelium discoideum AX4]EAL61162.1 hypothetical protein DDB_G0292718 [Dictyostelium discoideum AX4]|eukprot:XP_629502.1 hypothetical protein DDB_G0292718 [Dictyostelium discoideum AX4]
MEGVSPNSSIDELFKNADNVINKEREREKDRENGIDIFSKKQNTNNGVRSAFNDSDDQKNLTDLFDFGIKTSSNSSC